MPIATRYPPRNVFFELHDIKDQFRFGNSTIDLVHARSISMAVSGLSASFGASSLLVAMMPHINACQRLREQPRSLLQSNLRFRRRLHVISNWLLSLGVLFASMTPLGNRQHEACPVLLFCDNCVTRHPRFTQFLRAPNLRCPLSHARASQIRDYGALLPEIARLLRRGGLFVSCEWRRWPALADGSDIATHAPRTHAFFAAVRDTLRERRGIQPVAPHIPQLLAQSGWFTNIVVREHFMPIGEWHTNPTMRALGGQYREMVATYARSMRALLVEGGHAAHADDLVEGYITETWEVSGLYSTCFTIHARRV